MKISVYITSYNQKEYLIEAVDSVLAQTLKPHQIIIVDDASEDGSQEVIAGYFSRYPDVISAVYHQENRGVAGTRNDALKAVTGDYVTSLDGDDRYLPNKLELETQRLDSVPDAQVVFSNYYVIDAQGYRIEKWASGKLPEGEIFCQVFGRDFPKRRLFRDELVHFPSWKKIGFFDPSLRVYEDYDMRIRLTQQLKATYTNRCLTEHRRLESGLSKLNAELFLETFSYIQQKNQHLLEHLSQDDQDYVQSKLDEWKAVLLRNIGREALRKTPEHSPDRVLALRYYWRALKYHRCLDIPFILEWILTAKGYQNSKRVFYRGTRLRFRNNPSIKL